MSNSTIAEIKDWARADAKETFLNEMLAEWYWNVKADETPKPQKEWLENWMLGDRANEAEWLCYCREYAGALSRAIKKLEAEWDDYATAMDEDRDDVTEIENAVYDACIEALEAA